MGGMSAGDVHWQAVKIKFVAFSRRHRHGLTFKIVMSKKTISIYYDGY